MIRIAPAASSVSGGKKYIGIADYVILSNSIAFQTAVEVFTCKKCHKIEFYAIPGEAGEPEPTEDARLYEKYKDAPDAKLKKILDRDDYTAQCKAVVRKILSERSCRRGNSR